MLKQLRYKFIAITMTLVTVMLVLILGLVVRFTQENLETQSIQMMMGAASEPMKPNRPNEGPSDLRLPCFTVQPGPNGELIVSGSDYFDLSDGDLIRTLAEIALSSPEQTGVLTQYQIRFCKTNNRFGECVVFADISSEMATVNALIRNCVIIGILSFLALLLVSTWLARWAIRPVEQAWEQQKQFVADASHELKTPLTVIMTNAELLQHPDYDEDARTRFAGSILTMSRQMRGLVEGLLDLARVDSGVVKTAFAPVDLSALFFDALLPFEPLYFERGLLLESRVEPAVTVRGSAGHLEQVLKILLDNALKYSDPGTVTVTLQRDGGSALLTVANPGPAIPAEDRKAIFRRFYRADKARSRDGSYGLGLSIAENIVSAHRGRIWVESTDGINRFHVQIPIK